MGPVSAPRRLGALHLHWKTATVTPFAVPTVARNPGGPRLDGNQHPNGKHGHQPHLRRDRRRLRGRTARGGLVRRVEDVDPRPPGDIRLTAGGVFVLPSRSAARAGPATRQRVASSLARRAPSAVWRADAGRSRSAALDYPQRWDALGSRLATPGVYAASSSMAAGIALEFVEDVPVVWGGSRGERGKRNRPCPGAEGFGG